MLTLISPIETRFHRWPAGPKLAGLSLGMIALTQIRDPAVIGAVIGIIALAYATCGLAFAGQGARLLRPIWPFLIIAIGWHWWTGATAAGLAVAGRMLAAITLANLVTMTTRLEDMLDCLRRILRPIPGSEALAMAITLAIRFTPVLMGKAEALGLAWRARSPRRSRFALVVPLGLAAIDDADQVSLALRARGGFDPSPGPKPGPSPGPKPEH